MNLSNARVVDPVLTQIALGFENPGFVGLILFPLVTVPLRGGKVLEFGKENFSTVDTVRAPGSRTKRITVGFGSQTYALVDESLDAQVPFEEAEEAASGPGVDLQEIAINDVQEIIGRNLEIKQAAIARDPANYNAASQITLAPGSRFSDPTVDPAPIFEAAKKRIRKRIGVKPNTAFIPPDVLSALRHNPFVQEQVKFTGSAAPTAAKITLKMLGEYLGIDNVVEAESVVLDDSTEDMLDIWGKDVVLAWVNPRATNRRQPNFGYTYRLRGYPYVTPTRVDEDHKSWVNGYTDSREAKITMNDAAYLIIDAAD